MDFFGKKNEDSASAPPPRPQTNLNVPPTEKVLAMRNQGLSNNQIIQSLQREGYDSNMILDAMNQAELKSQIENGNQSQDMDVQQIRNPMQFSGQEPFQPQPPQPQGQSGMGGLPPLPPMEGGMDMKQSPAPDMNASMKAQIEQISIERIEEIAEAIIDEKWNEIVRSINKIIDWKERTENKMSKIEQMFGDLRKEFDSLNQGILGKVGEYDKNLVDLGSEIKAMEKVFEKIIPSLTENVHALEKIAGKMDKE